MLNLIYSGALTTLLVGVAVLVQFEKNYRINNITRGFIILSSFFYGISFLLFSESIADKSSILLRDFTLIFSVLILFRMIRNVKILFPILLTALIVSMSSFGFNHLHDSFKISKFSILKDASVSTDKPKSKKVKAPKAKKLTTKSDKN